MHKRSVLAFTPFITLFVILALLGNYAFAYPSDLVFTEAEKQWLKKNPTVSIAYDGHFPPYSFLTDDGKLEGFSVDLFSLLGKKLGIKLQTHPVHTWKELYEDGKQHRVDVVATMVERDERHQWFNFTIPYIEKSLVVITQAENQQINHKDDLSGATIALVQDYQYASRITKEYPSATPVYVETIIDALNAVSLGEADAAVAFLGAGHFYRTKYLLTNLKYAAMYDKQGSPESIAIRNDYPELASLLDKALKNISEADLQALRQKWLPVDYLDSYVEINLTKQEQQWIKDHPDIRLGIDPEFAPFEFMENGEYRGMASDYIRLLNQRLNLNMRIVKDLTWKEVTAKARNQEIDVLPAVGKTAERERFLNYTNPYLNFHRVIVARTDAPFIVDLNDLKGKSVAVQANSSHHGFIKENSDITPVSYATLKEALFAVSGGEAEAFVGNVASTSYWIRKLNLTNLKVAAPVSKEVQSLHFAVRKDWPELATILQKGLDSITPKQQRAISEKWTSIEYGYELDYNFLWRIAGAIITVIAIILLWNISLNRKVKEQTNQILHSAHYDDLTKLPNRFLIQDRLRQRINEAKQKHLNVAMLSIDIDGFRKVNDSHGHMTGDIVLKEVTSRLNEVLKEGDTLGRLSGDQFLLLLCDYNDSSDIASIAQSVIQLFERSFEIDGRKFSLSASVGISTFPVDGSSSVELIKNADSATHHAKEKAPGSYAFYTSNINEQVSRQLEVEDCLRKALEKNELFVVFQPKVDATTKQIMGFEALLRWTNKTLGNISPMEFIPIAEKTGQISAIGQYVLEQALSCLAEFQTLSDSPLSMAVNISPVQFRSKNFENIIKKAIHSAQVDCQQLEIEITEGILLKPDAGTEALIHRLTHMGVKLAMDDFGTGYSSMSNLRKFKFDTLKIDREFIRSLPHNESDCQLVSATILMAHGLGMKVVAEGVETEEQSHYLVSRQCDQIQGFLYGKPMSRDDVIQQLNSASQIT